MTLLSFKDYREGHSPKRSQRNTEEIANNIKEILECNEIKVSTDASVSSSDSLPSIVLVSPINPSDPEKVIAACEAVVTEQESIAKFNDITEAELLKIKGIGAKTAQKILAKKPFSSWRDVEFRLSEAIYRKLIPLH